MKHDPIIVAAPVSGAGDPGLEAGLTVRSRIESIQWLRGVAALLVVCVHAISAALDRAGGSASFVPAVPNLGAFGDSGVDLFFVISGFVMAHSLGLQRDARSFLVARWRRIWPLFVIASAVYLILFGRTVTLGVSALLQSVTILPVIDTSDYHQPALSVGWTLGFETMFYLLVATTIMLRRGAKTLLALTLVAAALGLVGEPRWAPLRMLINPIVAEFAFGVFVWLIWRANLFPKIRPAAFVLGTTLLLAGIGGVIPLLVTGEPAEVVAGADSANRALIWGLPWALIVIGLLGEIKVGRITAAILRRLGNASYSIYLFHFTVIGMITALAPLPSRAIYPFIASAIAIALAAGLAAHRWIERPLIRRMRGSPRLSVVLDAAIA